MVSQVKNDIISLLILFTPQSLKQHPTVIYFHCYIGHLQSFKEYNSVYFQISFIHKIKSSEGKL